MVGVHPGGLCLGVSVPGGCLPRGCLPRRFRPMVVSAQEGVFLGVSGQGKCLPRADTLLHGQNS